MPAAISPIPVSVLDGLLFENPPTEQLICPAVAVLHDRTEAPALLAPMNAHENLVWLNT
ncbi:MAG: hypothetical protein H0U50_14440, partial [Pyrinomonadaceae bacterium]|nr:hypothetical protein [Pyrinomonadaceae bacterium]